MPRSHNDRTADARKTKERHTTFTGIHYEGYDTSLPSVSCKTNMPDYYALIEAFVEGYRGGRDAPGFEECLRAEINKRFAELYEKTGETP